MFTYQYCVIQGIAITIKPTGSWFNKHSTRITTTALMVNFFIAAQRRKVILLSVLTKPRVNCHINAATASSDEPFHHYDNL